MKEACWKPPDSSSISDGSNVSLSKLWGIAKDREAWRAAVRGVAKSRTWLSDWRATASQLTIIYSLRKMAVAVLTARISLIKDDI